MNSGQWPEFSGLETETDLEEVAIRRPVCCYAAFTP